MYERAVTYKNSDINKRFENKNTRTRRSIFFSLSLSLGTYACAYTWQRPRSLRAYGHCVCVCVVYVVRPPSGTQRVARELYKRTGGRKIYDFIGRVGQLSRVFLFFFRRRRRHRRR